MLGGGLGGVLRQATLSKRSLLNYPFSIHKSVKEAFDLSDVSVREIHICLVLQYILGLYMLGGVLWPRA